MTLSIWIFPIISSVLQLQSLLSRRCNRFHPLQSLTWRSAWAKLVPCVINVEFTVTIVNVILDLTIYDGLTVIIPYEYVLTLCLFQEFYWPRVVARRWESHRSQGVFLVMDQLGSGAIPGGCASVLPFRLQPRFRRNLPYAERNDEPSVHRLASTQPRFHGRWLQIYLTQLTAQSTLCDRQMHHAIYQQLIENFNDMYKRCPCPGASISPL